MTLIGAAVTTKTGQTWPQAISDFEATSGRLMPVRRCYDGAPVSDIASSSAKYDLGARKSVLSMKPTITTPLTTLNALAASIKAAGHDCDVIIYHEPVDNMTGPDFIALYQRSAAPFRDAGIPVGVCYTNYSCNLVFSDTKSALAHYWPGDSVVDFLAIDEYPIGEITSTKDALPMDQRTRRVCQFADARGIQVGLAEYGVDAAWDTVKAERWMRSVTDWANVRAAAGKPLRWGCYFSSDVGGNYWLSNKPEYVSAYTDSYKILG
jgi:hypothetical protein